MKSILVTGASGQLGSELQNLSYNINDFEFIFTDIDKLDITSETELSVFFKENHIDYIINCAAYTAVDKAESEEQLCNKINSKAVEYLVNFAEKYNIYFITVSTDYVFDGTNNKPYTENDKTAPNSAYGRSKLMGEIEAQKYEKSIIIRTSWLYSHFGANFIKTMLNLSQTRNELNVISDQIGTPTYAADLAKSITEIIRFSENNKFIPGIYNYSNEGVTSWYDFAKAIFRLTNTNCKIYPIETKDYPTPAARPHYSVLNKAKIKDTFNIFIPHWEDSLTEYLKERIKK